jgi:hypothetical protein
MPATRPPDGPDTTTALPSRRLEPAPVDERQFREGFSEELREVLDIRTWRTGRDLTQEYPRIEREVNDAVKCETEHQHWARTEVFPKWASMKPIATFLD